jgi:hypothetical protein
MLLTALFAGALAGAIMLLLSHLAPFIGAGNFVRDLDNPHFFGKQITQREAHFLGILIHLFLSAGFGGIFALLVMGGVVTGYGFGTLMIWGVVVTMFMGGVVLPLEGHGLFGTREDAWFPVDLFLTNMGWALLFWWMIHLWTVALSA